MGDFPVEMVCTECLRLASEAVDKASFWYCRQSVCCAAFHERRINYIRLWVDFKGLAAEKHVRKKPARDNRSVEVNS
jgi:hypothetical protein